MINNIIGSFLIVILSIVSLGYLHLKKKKKIVMPFIMLVFCVLVSPVAADELLERTLAIKQAEIDSYGKPNSSLYRTNRAIQQRNNVRTENNKRDLKRQVEQNRIMAIEYEYQRQLKLMQNKQDRRNKRTEKRRRMEELYDDGESRYNKIREDVDIIMGPDPDSIGY